MFEEWQSTASVDLEEEDDDKGTLPRRPRGHKATTSDIKVISPLFH
jgi:hypothetical protein